MSLIWYRFWYRVNKEGSGIDPLQSLWYQNNTSPERVNWGGKTSSPPPPLYTPLMPRFCKEEKSVLNILSFA